MALKRYLFIGFFSVETKKNLVEIFWKKSSKKISFFENIKKIFWWWKEFQYYLKLFFYYLHNFSSVFEIFLASFQPTIIFCTYFCKKSFGTSFSKNFFLIFKNLKINFFCLWKKMKNEIFFSSKPGKFILQKKRIKFEASKPWNFFFLQYKFLNWREKNSLCKFFSQALQIFLIFENERKFFCWILRSRHLNKKISVTFNYSNN